MTHKLIGFTDEQTKTLEEELNRTDVLRQNPDFPVANIDATDVYDATATYEIRNNTLRDAGDGCHRWIFHFDHFQDIGPCKREIQRQFPEAFADPPRTVNKAVTLFQQYATPLNHWHMQW